MTQEVYLDLYVLVNVSMDLLCLMITSALLHRRLPKWRPFFAATLGGGYAAIALLLGFHGWLGFLLDTSVAFLICLIALYEKGMRFRSVLKWTAVFVLISMMMGGVMTGLYACLNRLHLPLGSLEGDDLSVWTFALLSAVAGLASWRGGRLLGLSCKTKTVSVRAVLFGKTVTLRAMVDTGNLLRDPVSGRSVIVADVDRLATVLPSAVLQACQTGTPEVLLSSYEHAKAIRPIPMQTASGDSLLFAIVPDELTVNEGRGEYRADYLIAPSSLGDTGGTFDAVIPID